MRGVSLCVSLLLVTVIVLLAFFPLEGSLGDAHHWKPQTLPLRVVGPGVERVVSSAGLYGRISYDDVAVVYNVNSPVSRALMENFTARRGIPPERIIGVDVPAVETINRETFSELRRQVEVALQERNLTTRLNYLVTVKGVPLRVWGPGSEGSASVDSELALILGPYAGYIGGSYWINNPYYNKDERFSREKYGFYIVTRLTGYNLTDALSLIDRAERSGGERGVFLLDVDPGKGGGYAIGNTWLRDANSTLRSMGYSTFMDETSTFITDFQNCSGYASWGSNDAHYSTTWNQNPGFESGIGPWEYAGEGVVSLNSTSAYRGTKCLEVSKNTTYTFLLYENISVRDNVSYYISGYVNMTGGRVHFTAEALTAGGRALRRDEGTPLAGPTGTWTAMRQLPLKPLPPGTAYLRVIVNTTGAGRFCLDEIRVLEVKPHNRWVPGAIAETYVSTSGRTFSWPPHYGQSLIADLIREGVSGVKGYVYEPYLSAMAEPHILFPRYVSGYTMGESYYMASPFLSWRGVVVGDPKMTPYGLQAVIASAELSDEIFNPAEEVTLRIRIENRGFNSIVDLPVKLHFPDGALPDMEERVNVSNALDVWFNFTAPPPGEYQCEVILNGGETIPFMNSNGTRAVVSFRVNAPPEVKFMEASSDYIKRGGEVLLRAGISDTDDPLGNLSWFAWVVSPGGLNQTLKMELKNSTLYTTFKVPINWDLGFASFHLLLQDPWGGEAYSTLNDAFFILNNPPVVKRIEWSEEVKRGSLFILNLTLQDPDTPQKSLQVSGSLQGYREEVDLETDREGEVFILSAYIPTDVSTGTYDITLTLSDGLNVTEFLQRSAVSVLNSPPGIRLTSQLPGNLVRGRENRIEVEGEDVEDPLSLLQLETTHDEVLRVTVEKLLPGRWEVSIEPLPNAPLETSHLTMWVLDSDGGRSVLLNITFHIINSPPEVEIKDFTVKSPSFERNLLSTIEVTVEARDTDGSGEANLFLNFSGLTFNLGTVKGVVKYKMHVWGNLTPGRWRMRAEVRDHDGGYASTPWREFNITDSPPEILLAEAATNETRTLLSLRILDEDLPPGFNLTLTVRSGEEILFSGEAPPGDVTVTLPPSLRALEVSVSDGYSSISVNLTVKREEAPEENVTGEQNVYTVYVGVALILVGAGVGVAYLSLRRKRSE